MKPFNPGDKVRSKAKPHITGTVKWVRFEPNGVSVNRQNSRGKWNYVQKIPKGGYTVSINWDPVPQLGYYPERPLHGLQGSTTIELVPQENIKQQPMTDKQIKFIRSLFLEVKSNMTIDEQESLIIKMKAHIDGTNVLTTKWASAAIDKLKAYKPNSINNEGDK